MVNAPIVNGQFGIYGRGGFIQNLAINLEDTKQILAELNSNNWIDRGTRAVFIDFTIYNANINLFCQIRLTIEQPNTGGATPTWLFRSVKLIRYVSSFDYFIMACEIIFFLFIFYYTIEEFIEVKAHFKGYFFK